MDALDLLRFQAKQAYAWLEMTVSDVTEEQANWQPPGTANSIGATYAHVMISADEDFNIQLHSRTTLIASAWAGRVGLSELPPEGFGWHWQEWASRVRIDWSAFREYAREVQRCVEGYFDALSTAELERSVDMSEWGLGTWKGLDIYNLHGVNHIYLHGGEIACLKGLQGGRGWQVAWQSGIERPA